MPNFYSSVCGDRRFTYLTDVMTLKHEKNSLTICCRDVRSCEICRRVSQSVGCISKRLFTCSSDDHEVLWKVGHSCGEVIKQRCMTNIPLSEKKLNICQRKKYILMITRFLNIVYYKQNIYPSHSYWHKTKLFLHSESQKSVC